MTFQAVTLRNHQPCGIISKEYNNLEIFSIRYMTILNEQLSPYDSTIILKHLIIELKVLYVAIGS